MISKVEIKWKIVERNMSKYFSNFKQIYF